MKIIKTNKYAQMYESANPYTVNFDREKAKAKKMTEDQLFFALKDAIEASQVSPNAGKYYDQASVYREELRRRGFSTEEQDKRLLNTKSLHTNYKV